MLKSWDGCYKLALLVTLTAFQHIADERNLNLVYDFLEIAIPVKNEFVTVIDGAGYVDFTALGKAGLKIGSRTVQFAIEAGEQVQVHELYHPWSNLPSSFTDIAVKVEQAAPQCNRNWAYVTIKASPAKVMQGHNVYGSTNLRTCTEYMLSALQSAESQFYDMLDIGLAEFRRIDCTYSVQTESPDVLRQAIKHLGNVSNRYLKPARNSDYETTLYFNKSSNSAPDAGRAYVLAVYSKMDEVESQLAELTRRSRKEPGRYDRVIAALSDPELRQFAANRLRFEGRAKKRFFERLGLSNGVWGLIRHAELFEGVNGYSFCEYMWKELFRDLLSALEGQELEIYHDEKIKKMLRKAYWSYTPKGNVSYAKAERLYGFYTRLCDRGYDEVKAHTSKATLSRNMRDLMAIGLSKANLQNLKEGEKMSLAKVLTFDFDNQRPDSYVEPVSPLAGIQDKSALAVMFGVSHRLSIELGTATDPITQVRDKLGLPADFDIEGLINGDEVPITPRESVSMIIWPDGEVTLNRHSQTLFKPNVLTALINPHFDASGYTSQYLN